MQRVQKGHRQYMVEAKNFIVFAGKNLRDFGLVFNGSGTHGAPLRDYTTVAIPGKNGELYIDNGRYMNTKVTYHVGDCQFYLNYCHHRKPLRENHLNSYYDFTARF